MLLIQSKNGLNKKERYFMPGISTLFKVISYFVKNKTARDMVIKTAKNPTARNIVIKTAKHMMKK